MRQIESTFYNHPASPHRDVFRVSNDRSEGCTGESQEHILKVKFEFEKKLCRSLKSGVAYFLKKSLFFKELEGLDGT